MSALLSLESARPEAGVVNLGPAAQIPPGEGRRFDWADLQLAVFRGRDGRLFAVDARCPHQGGPLADGTTGGGVLVCPLHGFKFELSTGKPLREGCSRLQTYSIQLSACGEMLLTLGSAR